MSVTGISSMGTSTQSSQDGASSRATQALSTGMVVRLISTPRSMAAEPAWTEDKSARTESAPTTGRDYSVKTNSNHSPMPTIAATGVTTGSSLVVVKPSGCHCIIL